MYVDVKSHERAIVLVDSVPTRYLGPGRHWVWAWPRTVVIERYSTTELIAQLDEARLALVANEDLALVSVQPHERAVVWVNGQPARWLAAGTHAVWTVLRTLDRATKVSKPLVRVEVIDTSTVEAPLLPRTVVGIVKNEDYRELLAAEGYAVVRWVDGRVDAVLPPGHYAVWNTVKNVRLHAVDMRERVVHVTGQEVMTKDRVSLRLNVSATVRGRDARQLAVVARDVDEVLYLSMQLAARQAVTEKTLDELLANRETLAATLRAVVAPRAEALGLELTELGLKDIVLPGEMKDLLNKVIQATKEAEANVILRREETAATRSLAQTAKVLQENPLLVRLKELEAYKELAAKVGKIHVVMNGASMPTLQLK